MRVAWLLLGFFLAPSSGFAADPSALWKIVNGKCVPHEQEARDPSPCALVDLADGVSKGFAILKDINGASQFLLIPTVRVGGIEDPAILTPGAPNYWEAAWRERYFVEERLQTELSRTALSLAINSTFARTQDQLHIHIDCVKPEVRDILAANIGQITDVWTPFPEPLAGHRYRAIRIGRETLGDVNPFRILADSNAGEDMGSHTLVLVGAAFAEGETGFVLLDDRADLLTGNRASGEQLQDHTCSVANK